MGILGADLEPQVFDDFVALKVLTPLEKRKAFFKSLIDRWQFLAELTQVIEAVKARVVAVAPGDVEGVAADRLDRRGPEGW